MQRDRWIGQGWVNSVVLVLEPVPTVCLSNRQRWGGKGVSEGHEAAKVGEQHRCGCGLIGLRVMPAGGAKHRSCGAANFMLEDEECLSYSDGIFAQSNSGA